MNSVYQFLLPGLILPLTLSLILAALTSRRTWHSAWGLAAIWLTSYFWIRGLPTSLPREALDWLWIIGIVWLGLGILPGAARKHWLWLSGLLTLSLSLIAWPVLRNNFFVLLSVELAVMIAAGSFVIKQLLSDHNASFSALSLAIVSSIYAAIATLGGSLLVGQLSMALAAALGGFAFYELRLKAKEPLLSVLAAVLGSVWLLCLILYGRVYAGLALGPITLLLTVLVLSRVLPIHRLWQLILFVGTPALAALMWLIVTQNTSGYY